MWSVLRRRLGSVRLAALVAVAFVDVRLRVYRVPLPVLAGRLAATRPRRRPAGTPRRLSRAVASHLRLGRRQPTCLVSALVLFKLLRAQGDPACLVIGLPPQTAAKDAHAWVELGGRDLGPPPGRAGHLAIARYPAADSRASPHGAPDPAGRRVL